MTYEEECVPLVVDGLKDVSVLLLKSLITSAFASQADLQIMAHPLGYFHARLHSAGPVSLRLHYWPALERPPATAVTPYHDHVWYLESKVIVGSVLNTMVELATDTGPFALAQIEQIDGVDAVVPSDETVRIQRENKDTHSVGDFYSIQPRVFHCTTIPEGSDAVTFVRAEVVAPGGPRTLVPVGYEGQAPARRYLSEVDTNKVRESLFALLRMS